MFVLCVGRLADVMSQCKSDIKSYRDFNPLLSQPELIVDRFRTLMQDAPALCGILVHLLTSTVRQRWVPNLNIQAQPKCIYLQVRPLS